MVGWVTRNHLIHCIQEGRKRKGLVGFGRTSADQVPQDYSSYCEDDENKPSYPSLYNGTSFVYTIQEGWQGVLFPH